MSSLTSTGLPALDCHAHMAPDVTEEQLAALGEVTIFAVTRSLEESEEIAHRADRRVVWGCGVHPGLESARRAYDAERLRKFLRHFVLIGEIGLDRRSGKLDEQMTVFRSILSAIQGAPVLASVHSAGCTREIVQIMAESPHAGTILHWFLGTAEEIHAAARLGCYFSVNSAMPNETLRLMPRDLVLPETDYPATADRGVRRPGDISKLESKLAAIYGDSAENVRWRFYRNLRTLALASGAIERLPEQLADRLLAV